MKGRTKEETGAELMKAGQQGKELTKLIPHQVVGFNEFPYFVNELIKSHMNMLSRLLSLWSFKIPPIFLLLHWRLLLTQTIFQ